jgi:hypothetical protein
MREGGREGENMKCRRLTVDEAATLAWERIMDACSGTSRTLAQRDDCSIIDVILVGDGVFSG